MIPDMAKLPNLIPIGDLWKYGGPRKTKSYSLLNQGKLTAIKTPWAR